MNQKKKLSRLTQTKIYNSLKRDPRQKAVFLQKKMRKNKIKNQKKIKKKANASFAVKSIKILAMNLENWRFTCTETAPC